MKNKILLIIAYFGEFHNYFDLFLKSCEWNPDVNWLIVTDNKVEYNYPKNVQKVETTFEQLKEKIQSLYDFPVALEKPYDLCDLKVAYGEIFQNYIKGYKFRHVVYGTEQVTLRDAESAEIFAKKVFEISKQAEECYGEKALLLYGKTPGWYIDEHNKIGDMI